MKKVTLDTNCFIDAFDPISRAYPYMQKIIEAHRSKQIVITVSRHTLSEIKEPVEALNFAQTFEILANYPIGTWEEQVAPWKELGGTWKDAEMNQELQEELEQLAKSGNDIRDRGAYIDAINAHVDAFVTSDGQFAESGPAERIKKRFGLRVITPKQLAKEIDT
jgi:predicted nucleic acid-binding protein